MKVRVFQSDKGDCLLLTDKNEKHILVDGGMAKSYKKHVAKYLSNKEIELVCVSHIDQDHIQGIIEMMKDITNWRVYKYQKSQGNSRYKKPLAPEPPIVKSVWHNAFKDQVSENKGEIENMLVASSSAVSSFNVNMADFIYSKREAIILSNKLKSNQLNIPVNKEFSNNLVYYRKENSQVKIGDFKLHIIGPFKEDLEKLRNDWNLWLEKSKRIIVKLRRQAEKDIKVFEKMNPASSHMELNRLGDKLKVTLPNLASIMFLLEEDGKSVLLTGDGHSEDILKGLKENKKLRNNGGIHVNVLKVQHHGSHHNFDDSFFQKVTADHYVFCGNGAHSNPELEVVKNLIESRIGAKYKKSKNQEVDNSFKIWFNSSDENTVSHKNKKHMRKLESYVKMRARKSNRKLKYYFMESEQDSFVIDLH